MAANDVTEPGASSCELSQSGRLVLEVLAQSASGRKGRCLRRVRIESLYSGEGPSHTMGSVFSIQWREPSWWLDCQCACVAFCVIGRKVGLKAETLADDQRFLPLHSARLPNAAHKPRDLCRAIGNTLQSRHTISTLLAAEGFVDGQAGMRRAMQPTR